MYASHLSVLMLLHVLQRRRLPIMSATSEDLETTFAFAGLDDECE